MKKPRVVYLVTRGDYSDYRVVGVFSTRELAQAYLDNEVAHMSARYEGNGEWRYYSGDWEIEEYPLDEPPEAKVGAWRVYLAKDGKVLRSKWHDNDDPAHPAEKCIDLGYPTGAREHICGYGPTLEHARRSAEEFHRVWLTTPEAVAHNVDELVRKFGVTGAFERFGKEDAP